MSQRSGRVWTQAELARVPVKNGFRIRGEDMTRVEIFTDAAFAFAVTLLVISVDDAPGTFAEFETALKSIPAFLASFLQLMMFWLGHRKWSELFGLDDGSSVWLSILLIAGVLILVYPLRAMYSLGFAYLSGGWLPGDFAVTSQQVAWVFVFYGLAFAALSGLILLLFSHAYRCRAALGLDTLERFDTQAHISAWSILAGTGVVSCTMALLLPVEHAPWSGWFYLSLGAVMPVWSAQASRRRARLRASLGMA